jgi:histidinol-phosphate/aromatic aminotransferase/cobyric acid decarboxylase-like protein
LWDPKSNPDGFVCLGVAENALMHDKLRAFLNSKKLVDPEARGLTYGDGPSGSKTLLQSLAGFFNKHWHPNQAILPRQITATNGVTAAIEHSIWALLNPGEGMLLGRAYYRAFLSDISLRTGAKVVLVALGSIDPLSTESVSISSPRLQRKRSENPRDNALPPTQSTRSMLLKGYHNWFHETMPEIQDPSYQ